MLKKRLIGVVTVRQGWAVQSLGYRRYLPLGNPEVLVENLDRWGVDEILVQCIDRSREQLGPNFDLINRIGALGLSTPLIYAGGLRHAEDAIQAVRLGADRLMFDAMLWDSPNQLESVSRELGTQAIIAQMPVRRQGQDLYWLNYRDKSECVLDETILLKLNLDWVSEIMLTDWQHDGVAMGFDESIPLHFPLRNKPLLLFGGLSESSQIQCLLSQSNIMAAGMGNFLSYKEHAIQQIKRNMLGIPMRTAHYAKEKYFL